MRLLARAVLGALLLPLAPALLLERYYLANADRVRMAWRRHKKKRARR